VSASSQDAPSTTLVGQLLEEYFPFAPPTGPFPDPTPAEGPDPYGNPNPEWLEIDWRAHLRSIKLEGARVNYIERGAGSGIPIVFVHGLSGSWQNWLENIPHFAREHRVIALDLPGFGHSPMPDWEISIEGYGRLLHDFCEALGVSDCAVVGNSMGGFISAEAVSADPDRFEKLVLVSAAGVSSVRLRRQPIETAARMATAATPLLLKLQERSMRRPRVRQAIFMSLFQHPEALRRELLLEIFQNGAGRPGFLPAIQGLVGYDILDQLTEVEVPTLIVWGRNDRVVPSQDAAGFAQRLRNSQTVIFDDTGHVPQLERPVRFNRVLETFLAA
jgi:pimeloyl-ACP methyl ester carboxylesterase